MDVAPPDIDGGERDRQQLFLPHPGLDGDNQNRPEFTGRAIVQALKFLTGQEACPGAALFQCAFGKCCDRICAQPVPPRAVQFSNLCAA
jgi:hypothetical protein